MNDDHVKSTETGRGPAGGSRALSVVCLAALMSVLVSCGDSSILDVEDPDVVGPDALEGPNAVVVRTNGVVGDFQEAFDDYVRYSSLFTDEMILGGTFPTRIDVDERIVQEDPDNATLTGDLYEPLHISRASADRALISFTENLDNPEFEEVLPELRDGIALAQLYGAYDRLLFAELYCQSIFSDVNDESAPVSPDQRMEQAVRLFQEAEISAGEAGLSDVATAAQVGQARALLWLGRYAGAADSVSGVSDGFVFFSEYSANIDEQWNEVFAFTNGAGNFNLRWTVGDGTAGNRHNERWPYFDEWVDQGLLDPDTDLQAVEIGVPAVLQLLYADRASDIVLASGWEARMIEAEAELRTGDPEVAEDDVNALLTDASQAANPMLAVNQDLPLGAFDPVDFTGDLQTDLPQLARARSAGLWLTGTRQGFLRRIADEDGVDLYPQGTQGDDRSFPIVQQEIDNNPDVQSGCP